MSSPDVILFTGICDTPFWDWNTTWYTDNPAFTPCFIDTFLVWIPSIMIWALFPYTLYDYWRSQRTPISWNFLNIIRLFISAILSIVGLIHTIFVIVQYGNDSSEISLHHTKAELIGSILTASSYILLTIMVHYQRKCGFVNGGTIWFFLLLKIILMGISIPTEIQFIEYRSTLKKVTNYLEFSIMIVLLLLCSIADRIPNVRELMVASTLYGKEGSELLIYDEGDENDDHSQNDMNLKAKLKNKTLKICPKEMASFPSKLTFWWFNSMALLGFKRPLVLTDMWQIRVTDHSSYLFRQFNKFWKHKSFVKQEPLENDELMEPPPKPNLFVIIGKQFWTIFLFPSIARLITDNLQLINPIVMKNMIAFTVDKDAPTWQGFFFTAVFVVVNVASSITSSYHQHRMSALGMRIRSCLVGAIYRKAMVLAPHSKQNFTTGEIVNLMAVDSQRFIDLLPWLCFLWTAPIQIGIALWLLWNELGVSILGGLILMILFIPINGYIASTVKRIQQRQMGLKDKRLKAINEMLNGMKVLKLYAWEEAFIENIQKIRVQEIRYIRKAGYISTIFNVISSCSPFMVSCVTFTIYILIDPNNKLDAEKAFVSIALFNLLRIPLAMIPNMMSFLIMTIVSMKRLNKFLNSDETVPYVHRKMDSINAISMTNATFSWERIPLESRKEILSQKPKANQLTLSRINLSIKKGSLVAVVGNVGSGKSSLLYSLLGEMQKISGSVNISDDQQLAYVAQQAWIQNETVRGNILFGQEYDQKRYQRVIEACALKSDFEMLTGGDMTEIGEKGINLSGGQKQRVSIARACYSNSNLFLFDDPLSAVDSHVGKHIFDQVISSESGILSGTTRVLVTNALYMLPNVDQIILLKNGEIDGIGSYEELLKTSPVFAELISNYSNSNVEEDVETMSEMQADNDEERMDEPMTEDGRPDLSRTISMISTVSSIEKSRTMSVASNGSINKKTITQSKSDLQSKSKLVAAEHMEKGQVTLTVYGKFMKALSIFWTVTIVTNYILVIIANTGSNFWLSAWTSAKDGDERAKFYLGIYFVIGISQAFFVCVGWISIVRGSLMASTNLHWKLLQSIVHAPMYFFDTTPLGRIINRFSKDIDILDSNIQLIIRVLLNTTLTVLATFFTVSVQTPIFIAVVIPFLALYIFVQRFYISTSRQIKRLESVTRSPIFNHFSETINGVSTIRAYNASQRFIDKSDYQVDENSRCVYPNAVANCFLQVRLEFMANFLIFFASLFAVLSKDTLNGSETGLSLSYALNITLSLNVCVRMFSEIENNVVSVERISEYTDVKPEAEWRRPDDQKLGSDWPQHGKIEFINYGTRYRPGLDLVLRKVDITSQKGEKIGIVGRTGAGKSSLTLALFRIIEAANGSIRMDGIDISKLGLQILRSRITIIPQDPVLFCGTIRFNLDPFDRFNDEQLWNVLELSHLKSFVAKLELGLEHQISEGGENLSVGQRQLICLARALLRRTNVLVLDEATAAVDMETDALIQSTIREQFSNCTILTIAHRLHTILDSDRVLVLDSGNVAEFDTPKNLLADQNSIFHSLAVDAGII